MLEIEVKAKITNPDEIIDQLSEMGCHWSEPIWQHDTVYLPADYVWTPDGNITQNPIAVIRIRREKGGAKLTLKIPQGAHLASKETELNISDPEAMETILVALNYSQSLAVVEKTRRKTKWHEYEICIDEVVDLGKFVEVETFSDLSIKEVQEDLFLFLERLGVKREQRVSRGYDVLKWAHDRKIKLE